MTQREYIIRPKIEEWKKYFMINYLFDRLLKEDQKLSDLELFEPRHDLCLLSNGTLAQHYGQTIRLISRSPAKIEKSRLELSRLLNGIPLINI